MRQLSEVDWGVYLRLPVIDNCRHEDFGRLCDILSSGHFGIVSPHRSFPHHHDQPQYGMRSGGDPEIFEGDQVALSITGTPMYHSRYELAQVHNERAWKKLCQYMASRGFNPLPISGLFTEKGGSRMLEAALVIPGNKNLERLTMELAARLYNQDSFIYCGEQTAGDVHLFEVWKRGDSGLPIGYIGEKIGSTKTTDDLQVLLKRLYA